jgi:hypothetical protein
VSNGPLLTLTVDGNDPGSVLDVAAATVHVRAEARGVVPLESVEILLGGEVVAEASAHGSPIANVALETDVTVPASGWLAARCGSSHQLFQRPANQRVFAHTSPVYLQKAGQPMSVDAAAVTRFLAALDRMLDWAAREGRFENDQQQERLAGIFRTARQTLLSRASTGK